VKPQPKAAAKAKKPAAKAKPQAKPAAKKAAKTPVKKALPKPAAKKPAAKAAAAKKPVPAKKAAAKPAAKAGKATPKVSKPAPKKAAPVPATKTTAAKATAAKTPAATAKAGAKPSSSTIAAAQPASSRAMPPRPDAATVSANPARATKPSARLAQITVPSMAQSVASTAAKASYTQTMSPSLLTPPPLVAVKKDPKLANNWKNKSAEELSDAEVLAMPDTEYMNDKQMAFFKRKLVQLKQDILNSAGETTEHLREDTVIVPDPADRATIEEEHALELRTRDRERKLLKKIEQSIARIDAGDYGYCDETGEPIGVGRLLARPTATLSLEAQQRRELKQKMFGD
jgi:DnaK suppressor protein